MLNRKDVCINFKKILIEDYEQNNDITRCLKSYIGFLMQFGLKFFNDDSYRKFTQWQIDDMLMSTYNPKIDTTKSILETLWRWSRRIGKSQKLTALAVFGSLMNLNVVWRATFTDQLAQASKWFNMNPFVKENRILSQKNMVGIYNSPDINISVLSEAKVASRGADWLFYDEGGMCEKEHKKYEYYEMSRGMIMDSQDARITHASTPAKVTSFHEASLFLEKEAFKLNTKLQSHHPWWHSTWLTKDKIERERELHFDCPWYVEQNYDALWVIPGGNIFTNVIEEGDPRHPEFPFGFLEAYKNKYGCSNWGIDFNGEKTQHFRIGIVFDDYYVYVLEETRFLDLWEIDKLLGSTEVEDGQFNLAFTEQTKRMGLNVTYKAWNEAEKQIRVAQLCNRKIVINKHSCPTTWKNLMEAGYDKNSMRPKLAKRPDQHGLDGLLHALHENKGVIVVPGRSKMNKRGLPYSKPNMYNRIYV